MTFITQSASLASSDDDVDRIEGRMHDLQGFLSIAGRRMGVRFTIEWATIPPADVPFSDTLIDGATKFASVDDLIAKLSVKFHWFSFEADSRHPEVIHVIDKRLRGKEGYALERKTNIEFAGTLDELCLALHKLVNNVNGSTSGSLHQAGTDCYTETLVNAKTQTVRQILTDAVPLRCYGPVLWRARMNGYGHDAAAEIDVSFGGPKDSVDFDRSRWQWWLDTAREHGARGKPLRCFFTIETVYRDADDPACCPVYLNNNETFESPELLVAELTKRVGRLTAVKDACRPEIVHLIDEELLKLDGYALDQSVTIDYEGSPDGLVFSLEQQVGAGPRRHALTNAARSGDPLTHIVAEAKSKPVREVLTDCIPLERTYDVLWHARTYLRKDDPQTTIEYRFPR